MKNCQVNSLVWGLFTLTGSITSYENASYHIGLFGMLVLMQCFGLLIQASSWGRPPSRWMFHSRADLAIYEIQVSTFKFSHESMCNFCKIDLTYISCHCYIFLGHCSLILLQQHPICHQFLPKGCLLLSVL